jgi:hypothetical protein
MSLKPSKIHARKCDLAYVLWLLRDRERYEIEVTIDERLPPGIVAISQWWPLEGWVFKPTRIYGSAPIG